MGLLKGDTVRVQPLSGGQNSGDLLHSHIRPELIGAVRWLRRSSQGWEGYLGGLRSRVLVMGMLDGMEDDEQALVHPERISGFGTEEDETVTAKQAVAGV